VVWAQAVTQLLLMAVVLSLGEIGEVLGDPRTFAPTSLSHAAVLVICFVLSVVLLGLLRAVWSPGQGEPPTRGRARARAIATVAACVLGAGLLGAGAALATLSKTSLGCDVFRFDREHWERTERDLFDERNGQWRTAAARALARCDRLDGLTRDQVGRLLTKQRKPRPQQFIGLTGASGLFGEEFRLVVSYGPDGTVTGARVAEVESAGFD
jgi:hypothetical protein